MVKLSLWVSCKYIANFRATTENKHMIRCSTYHMWIGNCKLKQDTTTHLIGWPKCKTPITPNAGKDMEQHELIHNWWKCKMEQPLWKNSWQFLTKIIILSPYNPEIALLGIYSKELKTSCPHKLCTQMLVASLFTITNLRINEQALQWVNG